MAVAEYIVAYVTSLFFLFRKKEKETLATQKALCLARIARSFSKIARQDGVAFGSFFHTRLFYPENRIFFNVGIIDVRERERETLACAGNFILFFSACLQR